MSQFQPIRIIILSYGRPVASHVTSNFWGRGGQVVIQSRLKLARLRSCCKIVCFCLLDWFLCSLVFTF